MLPKLAVIQQVEAASGHYHQPGQPINTENAYASFEKFALEISMTSKGPSWRGELANARNGATVKKWGSESQ
jgi:hypothetical protein